MRVIALPPARTVKKRNRLVVELVALRPAEGSRHAHAPRLTGRPLGAGWFGRSATIPSGAGVPPAFVLWPSRLKNHQPGRPVDERQPGRLPHYKPVGFVAA